MKLKELFDFPAILNLDYNDFLPLDDDHKSWTCSDKIPLQDDSEARFLVQRGHVSWYNEQRIHFYLIQK